MEDRKPETVGELMRLWLEAKRPVLKRTSFATYLQAVETSIIPQMGEVPLHEISREILGQFVERLYKRGMSDKSVCDINAKLNSALRWAVEQGYIEHAGFCLVLHLRAPEPMRLLTGEEQKKLERYLLHSDGERNVKTGILLCMRCGLRVGELCALRFEDVRPDRRILVVTQRLQRVLKKDESGRKTEIALFPVDPRQIPIPRELAEKVKALDRQDASAFFLTGRADKCMEQRLLQMRLKACLRACGLDESIDFNALHSTFITSSLKNGADICEVGKMIGAKRLTHIGERYRAYSFDRADPVKGISVS